MHRCLVHIKLLFRKVETLALSWCSPQFLVIVHVGKVVVVWGIVSRLVHKVLNTLSVNLEDSLVQVNYSAFVLADLEAVI